LDQGKVLIVHTPADERQSEDDHREKESSQEDLLKLVEAVAISPERGLVWSHSRRRGEGDIFTIANQFEVGLSIAHLAASNHQSPSEPTLASYRRTRPLGGSCFQEESQESLRP